MSHKHNGGLGDEHLVRKVDLSDSIGVSSVPSSFELPLHPDAYVVDTKNPVAFGLFGFSMQLTLIGLLNGGYIESDGAVVVYSFVLVAGILQLIVTGLAMLIKKNLFGAVAFTVLGSFAISMAVFNLLLLTGAVQLHGPINNAITSVMAIYAYISFIFLIASIKMDVAGCVNFLTITLVFATSAVAAQVNSPTLTTASSWLSIVAGLVGFYLATGAFLGETFQRPVLPMGDFSRFGRAPAPMPRRESGATEFMG
ncbi:hypothetical protein M427DRAFT_41855 [Gonapodya prolifera JEL478]|uniref:Uncharacterized protein n=1 Tax=Gonapodya prolifera (strain JEL478) TaxID=1344416 RepID=A0A139ASI8_GONPJ|nr:hypothetical protein M427DRAFT_41855 [Gonapodya prolifera JEL478]|eukprot:KXS19513.1 hypothetical protein M427DRAFT_41855 [Gonapodya prolifera JEL478]